MIRFYNKHSEQCLHVMVVFLCVFQKAIHTNNVHKVTMTSTIAICCVGLMYTNPLVTVADVAR